MPIGRLLTGSRKLPRFSYLPVARSSRMTCERSVFLTQALPSTFLAATEKCDCCVASVCHSSGTGKICGRTIEARHPRLVHQADPEIAVRVDLEIEGSFGMIGFLHRNREIRYLPGFRVELRQELLAEMREPDHAGRIDNDVVGLNLFPRKIVFRDDDPRRASGRTRRDFGLEVMRRLPAEIDTREIVRELFYDGTVDGRPPVLADEPLWLQVGRAGILAAHALEHFEEISRRTVGFAYPAQRMAIRAVEQRPFELVGARHARHPLRIRQLIGRDRSRLEPQVARRRFAGRELDEP